MNKSEALYKFFNSFDLPAYPNFAPDDSELPFMIYETSIGGSGDLPVNIALNIYYYTDSEAIPNAKVEEISERIGRGGIVIHHDDGAIWIQRGNPISVATVGENASIKHRQMNLSLSFL